MLCSDEENLSAQERANITALWQGVIQSLNEPLSEAPIGDEYCWMHTPGGWDCWTCYQERKGIKMKQWNFTYDELDFVIGALSVCSDPEFIASIDDAVINAHVQYSESLMSRLSEVKKAIYKKSYTRARAVVRIE